MENPGWKEKINQFKIPVLLSFLGVVLIIGGIFASGLNRPSSSKTEKFPKESLVESQKMISVDVSGAVNKPGVYSLKDGSRIESAIEMAGGFREDASGEYISKYLNMAQKLGDGTKIYVPVAGESGVVIQTAVAGTSTQVKVNINTASQSELEALSGIGPVSASRIISDRPYSKTEELLDKKIISKSVFEKIKEQLVVY